MKISSLTKKLLSVNRLARYLNYNNIIEAARSNLQIEIVDKVTPDRVMVIVPHPDDEALGCGGYLIKHQLIGSNIRLVYLSSGAVVNGSSSTKVLAEARREEANLATKLLSAENVFFDLKDGQIEAKEVAKLLLPQIREFKPETILLPSELDDHQDHRQANLGAKKALCNVLKESGKIDIKLMFYEVWTPLYPNRLVTIDPEAKRRLINIYQSQLKIRAYDKAILGLNDYRGLIMGARGPAEAFFAIPARLWLKLNSS